MILTYENLHAAATCTNGCGYTKQQLVIIGVLKEGQKFNKVKKRWLKSLIGTEIPDEVYNAFLFAGKQRLLINANKRIQKGGDRCNINLIPFIPVKHEISWKDQYKHPNWQKLRTVILERDKFRCNRCRDNQSQLHVHHLEYDSKKYIWALPLDKYVTLCKNCHELMHGKLISNNYYENDKILL